MTQWLLLGQAAPGQQPADAGPFGSLPLLIMGLFALYLVCIVLPGGRRERREKEALLKNLKRGARVTTTSGIVGTVVSVKDTEDEIVVRSEDARFRMKRSMVLEVTGSDEAEAKKE